MRRGDLAVSFSKRKCRWPWRTPGRAPEKPLMRGEASGVFAEFTAAAARFDADHLYVASRRKL